MNNCLVELTDDEGKIVFAISSVISVELGKTGGKITLQRSTHEVTKEVAENVLTMFKDYQINNRSCGGMDHNYKEAITQEGALYCGNCGDIIPIKTTKTEIINDQIK